MGGGGGIPFVSTALNPILSGFDSVFSGGGSIGSIIGSISDTIGGIFKTPSTPDIPSLPPAPTKTDATVSAASKAMADMLRKRKGMLSTIIQGPSGDQTVAPTQKAELLGGTGGYG
jgi:hypothetical protein